MSRLLLTCCLVLTAVSQLTAQELSSADRKRAEDHLKKTRDAFVASTQGLSSAQLNFKPSPTTWSVAEVAEHIAASEDFLFNLIQEKVMVAPPRKESADLKEIDDFVVTAVSDRTKKVQAPEPLVPTKRFGGVEDSVKHFKASRAKTVSFLTGTKGLREHAMESPFGKVLDAYQWVLFISAHSDRHTKQITEVKAHANFPKK